MSMSQQQETRTKRRFNVIDAFIIVLVLLCVLGVYFRGQIAEWIGIEKKVEEYQITFEVSEIRYTSSKYFYTGSKVYLDSGNIVIGTIEGNCTVLPAEIYLTDSEGAPVLTNYPKDTYVDVTGSIKCLGIQKEGGFFLNGTYSLAPGSKVNVHTEMLNFSMTITEIEKISK